MEDFTISRAIEYLTWDCLKKSPKGEFLRCPGGGNCYYLPD